MEATKTGRTRRRLNEQAWRALMKRFDGAAMTIQEFCAREGLSRSSFGLWRSRLKSAPLPGVPAESAVATGSTSMPPFVDLGLLGAATGSEHAVLDLRIELGGGLCLHLVRR
jgi:hypothetical protein